MVNNTIETRLTKTIILCLLNGLNAKNKTMKHVPVAQITESVFTSAGDKPNIFANKYATITSIVIARAPGNAFFKTLYKKCPLIFVKSD